MTMGNEIKLWDKCKCIQKIRKGVQGKLNSARVKFDYVRGRWNNYFGTIGEFGRIFWTLSGVIVLSIFVILIAKSICGTLFLHDNVALFNATLFQDNTNATLLSVCVNAMLTMALILVTASYALDTSVSKI